MSILTALRYFGFAVTSTEWLLVLWLVQASASGPGPKVLYDSRLQAIDTLLISYEAARRVVGRKCRCVSRIIYLTTTRSVHPDLWWLKYPKHPRNVMIRCW